MHSNYLAALRAVFSGISQRQAAKAHGVSRDTVAILVRFAESKGWTGLYDLEKITPTDLEPAMSRQPGVGANRIKAMSCQTMSGFTRSWQSLMLLSPCCGRSMQKTASPTTNATMARHSFGATTTNTLSKRKLQFVWYTSPDYHAGGLGGIQDWLLRRGIR